MSGCQPLHGGILLPIQNFGDPNTKLVYLVHISPNITFLISVVSQLMHC